MATTVAVPPEAPQPPINHFGRLFGALFSPKPTFEDISRRPSWIAPILALTILSIGVCYLMNQKIDWGSYLRTQAEKNSRFAQLSEDQKAQALAPQLKFTPYTVYAAGVLAPVIVALVIAAVYLGAFNLFAGAGVRFKQSFGIVAHASMPAAISSILILITLAIKPYGEATPENMLASHAGIFLSSDAPRWQMSLLSSFELFWFWTIALLGIGFAAVNPKKLTVGKSIGIVAGVWLVYVLVKVGITFAVS